MSEDFITPDKAAEMLGVEPRTIARWSDQGELSPQKTRGGQRRYDRDEVRDLVEKLRAEK